MKKIIRFTLVLIVIAIFAFSNNTTITNGRNFVAEEGKALFSQADTLFDSEMEKQKQKRENK